MNLFKKTLPIIISLNLICGNLAPNVNNTKALTGAMQDASTTQYPNKNYRYPNGYNNFSSLVVPTVINAGDYCSISGNLFVGNQEKNYRVGICVCPSSCFSDSIDSKIRNQNKYASYLSSYKNDRNYNLSELDTQTSQLKAACAS